MTRFHLIDLLVLVVLVTFASWLMSSTFVYRAGEIQLASKLYSDFGAHLPLIRSFSLGWNWPPEYPFFAGEPIRYHYLFYAFVGLLERAGLRLDWALNLPSIFGLSLLLFMTYQYGKTFFERRWAGLVAVLLFLFNGSLAWVEYFDQQGWSWAALTAIPHQEHFASFGPWSGRLVSAFWNWNILTNQRHLALGYGLILLALFPLVHLYQRKLKSLGEDESLNRWLWSLPIWVIFLTLPLLHQAAFTILAPLTVIWLLLVWPHSRVWLILYLPALWLGVLSFFFFTTARSQPLEVVWGFLAVQPSPQGILQYWWYNLGFYLPLLPPLLWWSVKKRQWWLWTALPFFLLANSLRLSPDMINNHKLITFFLLSLNLTVAGFFLSLWRRRFGKWIVIFLFPLLTFSGWLDLFPILNDSRGVVADYPRSAMTRWIMEQTEPRAQFVTASYFYSPASLAGRFLFLDYGYHAWSMGYDDREKRLLLPQLWSATISLTEWCRMVRAEEIDYFLVGPGERAVEDGRIDITVSRLVSEWRPTFISPDGWRVWRVNELCPRI